MRSVQSTLFSLLLASGAAVADSSLNLTPGVSPISHDIYDLHMAVFWICVVIGVVVFGAMFYSIIYHRKSRGVVPAEFHHHTWLEIGWTVVPAVILIAMAVPAGQVLLNINNEDQSDLTIKITGYQWKWHYEYLEDGISYFSNMSTPLDQINNKAPKTADYLREVDRPLVIPIHKKVRFLITSNDVNHAWWVPDLAVKRDAISGFINEAWSRVDKPGTYRGQCAELCGINHAYMPIVVVATTEQGYKDWVAKQKGQGTGEDVNKAWTMPELMKEGEKVYGTICAACHQPNGAGSPPTFPALKGSAKVTGPIATHIETVMNGVSGTAMQAFKNQLNDTELAAVITYERNAWGNNAGNFVLPIQIKAYRDGKPIAEALTVQPTAKPPGGKTKPPAPAAKSATSASTASTSETVSKQTDTTSPTVNAQSTIANQSLTKAPTVTDAKVPAPQATPAATASKVQANPEELKAAMKRGEKVYLGLCAACHQPTGLGMPPTFPSLKDSKIVTGPALMHINRVMNGVAGTAMLAFKDQLTDQEIADVVTYERNSWGLNTGTLVSPQEIKELRKQPQNNQQGVKQ